MMVLRTLAFIGLVTVIIIVSMIAVALWDMWREMMDTKRFVKDRDEAFTDFVLTGSTKKVRAYCKKYGMPIPKNNKVFAAGIYKAVQQCTNIPEEVKEKAFMKCLELGFSPLMKF